MRQLTWLLNQNGQRYISKLPMRQLTVKDPEMVAAVISKLPMRQLTAIAFMNAAGYVSKLPMRQLTMPERKKNPTARALIHLFPTLTQIYSCFKIY